MGVGLGVADSLSIGTGGASPQARLTGALTLASFAGAWAYVASRL